MRYLAAALLVLLCAACMPGDPASLEAQAAAMRRNTQEAVGLMGVQAQYTAAAQDSNATATAIAADLQLSAARATSEMAVAAQMQHAAELDALEATAKAAPIIATMTAQPVSAQATATRQAQEAHNENMVRDGAVYAVMVFGVFLLAALFVFVWKLGGYLLNVVGAWADAKWAAAKKHELLEASPGLMVIDALTGQWRPLQVVDIPSAAPQPTEIPAAPAAPRKPSPTLGELEVFLMRAIEAHPRRVRGENIPRYDVMKMSGAFWSARMDRLEALGFIPRREQGKQSALYAHENLGTLLVRVREYEQGKRTPTSPAGG